MSQKVHLCTDSRSKLYPQHETSLTALLRKYLLFTGLFIPLKEAVFGFLHNPFIRMPNFSTYVLKAAWFSGPASKSCSSVIPAFDLSVLSGSIQARLAYWLYVIPDRVSACVCNYDIVKKSGLIKESPRGHASSNRAVRRVNQISYLSALHLTMLFHKL